MADGQCDLRREWFTRYIDQLENRSVNKPPRSEGPYNCPSCGCKTLPERDGFDICPVCFWEDDGQDNGDADVVRGGPNGRLSLSQARLDYLNLGACEQKFVGNVRQPRAEELP